MKMKKYISSVQDRLGSHRRIILLSVLTVTLTTVAMTITLDFLHQKDNDLLITAGAKFQASLIESIANEEAELPSVLADLTQEPSGFDKLSQKVLDSRPHYLRLELRNASGKLMGSREASNSAGLLPESSLQEVPPDVAVNFFKSISEQKIYWTRSYAPSGESTFEAIVPHVARQQVLLVKFNSSHWLPNQTGRKLPNNIQVSFNESPQSILKNISVFKSPSTFRGVNGNLEFSYKNQNPLFLSPANLIIFAVGLSLLVLIMSFNLEDMRLRQSQALHSQRALSMFKSSQLMTLGEISTALAHEINQPLTTIANHIATCEIRLKQLGYHDKTLEEALNNARAQALRAGEVVHSIRLFLKHEPLFDAIVDYEKTILELMPIISAMGKESQANVQVIAESGLLAKIDPSLFEQIVINLCKNGLDSMENRPPSERNLILHAHSFYDLQGVQWARVDVSDTGHGVAKKDADNLFESFFTTKENGLGIGLNLCRSIAETYEGHIIWKNNDDVGATFSLELPKLSPPSSNAQTTAI